MSTKRVKISTLGGWAYETTFDDSLFSDIIAPIVELGEDESEILISGSVADVIEQKWNKWLIIKKNIEDRRYRVSVGGYKYLWSNEVFSLSEVADIMAILNPPIEWHLCTYIDESATVNDRLNHYVVVGNMVNEKGLIRSLPSHYNCSLIGSLIDPYNKTKFGNVLLGITWNLLIRCVKEKKENKFSFLELDWNALASLASELEYNPEEVSVAKIVLDTIGSTSIKDYEWEQEGIRWEDAVKLYRMIIRSDINIEEFNLSDWGLGCLLRPTSNLNVKTFISAIHWGIVSKALGNIHPSKREDKLPELFHAVRELDTGGMNLIKRIIDHHCKLEGYNMKIEDVMFITMFASMIEEELDLQGEN